MGFALLFGLLCDCLVDCFACGGMIAALVFGSSVDCGV